MPSADPIVAVPANGAVNGTNGESRPQTPMTGMALTEYSANPSTPSAEKQARLKEIVPDEYLLPTGYPDVSFILFDMVSTGKLTEMIPSTFVSSPARLLEFTRLARSLPSPTPST
jgi:hypothetical protein